MAQDNKLRILVIAAHPHDFTHVSGTCGKHTDRGDQVTVLSVTGGLKVHNEPLERELRKPKDQQDLSIINEGTAAYGERKLHELHDVCGVFGITDVRVLSFADCPLDPSRELDQAIMETILDVRPHVLITHAPGSVASRGRVSQGADDHRVTGIAAERAAGLAGNPNAETRIRPHRITKTFFMGVDWPYSDWDLVIDITDQAIRRVKAEAMFVTQGHTPGFAVKRIQIGSGVAGWSGGFAYGEAFLTAARQLDDHLPVSDLEMRQAEKSSMERLEQMGTRIEDLMEREGQALNV